ncbi:MAG: multi-sensor hybrid histidine kinase [Deferribacteraceae bacterium]|jgi:PAS domain S-box-containing protein|nr:multi-sensor hybrid histidine kinase [Deferribacteraceae bacterium]
MTGYEREELIGNNPRILKSGKQDQKFYEDMWNTLLSGKSFTSEIVNKKKNGELYFENAIITPIVDNHGKVFKIVAVKEDITEKKQLQEQLNQTQKLDSIGQLAGGVAHDFNNILSAIMGYVELAKLQIDNKNALPAYLDNIMAATERAANLTEKLLIFARKKPTVVENINIADVINSFENMLKRLIGEEIELIINKGENISFVKGNKGQIEQILLNLCINAKDAINGIGKIIINVENVFIDEQYCKTHSGFTPGNFVCLSVTDNGCGMDKALIKNIFEPFFTTKEVGKGTGLGLSTVYGIVKQHNGFINVYSELGVGTTFRIYFPAIEKEGEENKQKHTEKFVFGMKAEKAANILLVEDDEILNEAFKDTLNKIGYNVFPATSPEDALDIVRENGKNIDLIITDVIMPGMSGRALVDTIRDYLPDIKVIFMSGYNEELVSERGIFVEEVKFLQKPFTLNQLVSIIFETLSDSYRETNFFIFQTKKIKKALVNNIFTTLVN